jgi:nucleoid DNA-binding protein
MLKSKIRNFTKSNIAKEINTKIGLSKLYSNSITEDFILILKNLIRNNKTNIKNFGTFKVIYKKERTGRNPKTKKSYKITKRKSLSFIVAKKIDRKINNL